MEDNMGSCKTNILLDMYYMGLITQSSEDNMAHLETLNKEFDIIFSREDSKWKEGAAGRNIYYNYFCNLSIYNSLSLLQVDIHTTESDIFILLDNLNEIYLHHVNEIIFSIHSIELSSLSQYVFCIQRNTINNDIIEIVIYESNFVNHQKIFKLRFFLDEFLLEDFMNIIYFIFLIDIDNNSLNIDQFL